MLEKNYTEDHFIRNYNPFFKEGHPMQLTAEELYIYGVLFQFRMFDESMITSVHLIEQLSKVKLVENNQKRNRTKILKTIQSLIGKKVLLLVDDITFDNMKNDTLLRMEINMDYLEPKGFEKFPFQWFIEVDNVNDYYIYCVVSRFANENNTFNCSMERWSKVLQCSINTAKKYVEQAITNKRLFVKRGKYISQNKQELNKYSTTSFD